MKWLDAALKALGQMRHPAPLMLGWLKRTRVDYQREAGDGLDSSVVLAPVQWVQRALPEARLRVVAAAGGRRERPGHRLTALIRAPNPFHGDVHLWAATVLSYLIAGNAYWLKVRNGAGRPVELWWAPHWAVAPKWPADGSAFISHYEYRPGGGAAPVRLDAGDVVHFRHGVDPRNPRLGLSPLAGTIREIFMDLEASNFTAAMLKNMGVPGIVISPDAGAAPAPEDVESVKAWFAAAFGGDNRGAPLVMGAGTRVQQYGFSPQQMDMSVARNVAEERVCACLGIPAAVVGFGAGLETAKVGATMEELRRLAWVNGVLPVLTAFADELNRSLLPDLGGAGEEVEFDVDGVNALADNRDRLFQRLNTAVAGGWAMVAEARAAAGLPVDDSHRIYLRPFSAVEVAAGPMPGQAWSAARGGKARRRPSPAQRAYAGALERMAGALAAAFAARLGAYFGALGEAAAETAAPLLEVELIGQAAGAGGERKADELLVERILAGLDLAASAATLAQHYERHYLTVASQVAEAGRLVGLATDLPDPVARAVVAAGGRRAGLIDIAGQSRTALFEALAEGRAAGEGVEALARRIAGEVAAGPWTSAETRAIVIARTETKFAQNVSTIETARHAGAERLVVFDGRLGHGRSDPDHIARDGMIVTAAEAAQMAAAEHPNGTLSFAPHFDLDDEDET